MRLNFIQNNKIYIYSSSPKKSITGHAYIEKIEKATKREIKRSYLDKISISADELENYLVGDKKRILIWLKEIIEYEKPIPLAKLKKLVSLHHNLIVMFQKHLHYYLMKTRKNKNASAL
ncbi:hypothetical protein ABN080_14700 [Proteus sp. fly-1089]|uniref:hypothetical protein n=1 Tax=Proteus sp. fly-1089 TaxID=3136675 RepID=UPI0032D9C0D9